jgi:hypothetical protein
MSLARDALLFSIVLMLLAVRTEIKFGTSTTVMVVSLALGGAALAWSTISALDGSG